MSFRLTFWRRTPPKTAEEMQARKLRNLYVAAAIAVTSNIVITIILFVVLFRYGT